MGIGSSTPSCWNYDAVSDIDSPGGDIRNAGTGDLCTLARQCDADPRCRAFNASGWLKANVGNRIPQQGATLYLKRVPTYAPPSPSGPPHSVPVVVAPTAPVVVTPTVPAPPVPSVPLAAEEEKYDKLVTLLVQRDANLTNIIRTYFFLEERNPMRRVAMQDKLLSDARAYAAGNRANARKLGMDMKLLEDTGMRRDVSKEMADWISKLARAQNNPIVGALVSAQTIGAGAVITLLPLLLTLLAVGGIVYAIRASRSRSDTTLRRE